MNTAHRHQTFDHGAASGVLVSRPDGVSILSVYGPVTDNVFEWMRAQVKAHATHPMLAFCLRMDRAMVAFGKQCMATLAPESLLTVSAAIVVAPALQAIFQDYCWRMAELGYVRVVFTSPSEALLWSVAQARLAKAQSAWMAQQLVARSLLKAA